MLKALHVRTIDVSSKLKDDKTMTRERYRKRRESETVEQREQRNVKMRKKYFEKVL